MESKFQFTKALEPLHVLLIGNNPIDMSTTLEKIHQIKGRKIMIEIAFDLRSILERLMKFRPNFILIDDNIGKTELAQTIDVLSHQRRTRDIPITVLKNSNYQEALPSGGILDYLLKQNFSGESLYTAIRNSLKFKRTQLYLSRIYQKGKLKK